ncbi:hypothetical protein [Lysinibacillus sp. 54212]|uniref:hypothetical protein n=1 Tax=Lysinibacillus sp. 54212 TaxID=3119829 RepID=UPI002FC9DD3D
MKKNHVTNHLKHKQEVRRRMSIKGKQEKKEFGGDTFLFQHPGIEKAVQIQDNSRDENGNRVAEDFYKELFEHVIFVVEDDIPQKVNMAHFEKYDSMKVFTDVLKHATKFIFR